MLRLTKVNDCITARGLPLPVSGCFGGRGAMTGCGRTLTFANDKNRPTPANRSIQERTFADRRIGAPKLMMGARTPHFRRGVGTCRTSLYSLRGPAEER